MRSNPSEEKAVPQTLTIQIPDESFKVMARKAAQAGQTPEEWALARLRAFAPTDKEREEGIQRILRRVDAGESFFGRQ